MAKKLFLLPAFLLSFNAHAMFLASGIGEIYGTYSFDFENYSMCSNYSDPTCDVFWDQMTDTTRQLSPIQNAGIIALGAVDFSTISETDLLSLAYSADPIAGPPEGSLLNVGNVFAVNTREGNYVLVEVTGFSTEGSPDLPEEVGRDYYDIHIRYDLYDGTVVPIPAALWLFGSGLIGLIGLARRKS